MREHSLLSLFRFVVMYPIAALAACGFAILHHRLANRFQCFGFFRNLLYGLCCATVSVGLFFGAVFLVRFTGLSSLLLVQVIMGFTLSAFIVVMGRFVFAQTPPKVSHIPTGAEEEELGLEVKTL